MKSEGKMLYLYMDKNGQLWSDHGSHLHTLSAVERSVGEVITTTRPSCVRMYGTESQANTILEVCAAIGRISAVQIGRPDQLPAHKRKALEAKKAMQLMAPLSCLSPYFGGWRTLDITDMRMLRFMSAQLYGSDETRAEYLRAHPAYSVLSFLAPDRDDAAKCQLLRAIEDPRWFHTEVNHPEKETRLRLHLGITPKNITAVTDGKVPIGYNRERLTVLLQLLFGKSPPLDKVTDIRSLTCYSHCFPFLVLQQGLKRGPYQRIQELLDLAVSFIRQAWLQELAPPGREVFVPSYFFESLGEAGTLLTESFLKHACRSSQST